MKTTRMLFGLVLLLMAVATRAEEVMVEGATRTAKISIDLDKGAVVVSDTIDANLNPEETLEYFAPGNLSLYTIRQGKTELLWLNGSKAAYRLKGKSLNVYLWPGDVLRNSDLICQDPPSFFDDAQAVVKMTVGKNVLKCKVDAMKDIDLRESRGVALNGYDVMDNPENAAAVAKAPEWKEYFLHVNDLIRANYDMLITQNGNTMTTDETMAVLTKYTNAVEPLIAQLKKEPDSGRLQRSILFAELRDLEVQTTVLLGNINHDDITYTVTVKRYLENESDYDSITTCKAAVIEITAPTLSQPIEIVDKGAASEGDIKDAVYQWRIVDGNLECQTGTKNDSTEAVQTKVYVFNLEKQNLFLKSEKVNLVEKDKRKGYAEIDYFEMEALEGDEMMKREDVEK